MKSNLFICGADAFSYATCIRTQMPDGAWVLNVTKYSKTTSTHQREAFDNLAGRKIEIDNVERGVDADDLRRLASHAARTWNVVRFYRKSGRRKIILRNVTEAVARLHCNDPRTRREGVWFDGMEAN